MVQSFDFSLLFSMHSQSFHVRVLVELFLRFFLVY